MDAEGEKKAQPVVGANVEVVGVIGRHMEHVTMGLGNALRLPGRA